MKTEIPILVESHKESEGGSVFFVRPLFYNTPHEQDRHLNRAMEKLSSELQRDLRQLARVGNHRNLATRIFSPDVELRRLELRLELRGEFFRGWFPIATFYHMDRNLAFTPWIPDVWFEHGSNETLAARAETVYTRYFRDLEKDESPDEAIRRLKPFRKKTRSWISLLDVNVNMRREYDSSSGPSFALLGDAEPVDGREELEKVGRCLNRLYPDHLDRALSQDRLVDELEKLLDEKTNRPLMLVGPPLVGKTALIHELVHRRVELRGSAYTSKRNVWLLSPQRMISGMSYVGQWENRLLAILKTMRKKKHVLYLDDILGLYRAGVTSQSSLSVADVMRPYIERREVQLLAEITPEALRIFRERDRGFADLFHLIPVEEPDERNVLRILLGVVRRLEIQHRVRFGLECLPTVLELTRRYQREEAYPGKAARWLGQLAVKHQKSDVGRRETLDAFHAKSGLEETFLDAQTRLPRTEIVTSLASRILGQQRAIDAMTDVVSVAKARLNDPSRPLGSLFFLGPTGVGKTQSAKALAEYLFGDESRLLRFDMNEFLSAQAVTRLVGTFDHPEGLLTSAIRRQPFAVVLFDEIEKAAPEVFDLLLQILGEARLTDALGRTSDFSGAVVILTSNLGTREASREIGFGPSDANADAIYLKAVRDFFRPEFINRLDRIVPFQRLEHDALRKIAHSILNEVTQREGLRRRKCAVEIDKDAVEWLIERGTDRLLGARAMRRAVEQELVRPVAVKLAAIAPEVPAVLSVSRRTGQLSTSVIALTDAARLESSQRNVRFDEPQDLLDRARAAVDRIEQTCSQRRPNLESSIDQVHPETYCYLGAIEFLKDVRGLIDRAEKPLRHPRRKSGSVLFPPKKPRRCRYGRDPPDRKFLLELNASLDLREYLDTMASAVDRHTLESEEPLRHMLDKLALLETLSPSEQGWSIERVAVLVRSLQDTPDLADALTRFLEEKFAFRAGYLWKHRHADAGAEMTFGLEATLASETQPITNAGARHSDRVILFEGHRAHTLLAQEYGTHVFTTPDGLLQPLQVAVFPLEPDEEPTPIVAACVAKHERSDPQDQNDPLAWRPVVGIYTRQMGLIADPRTGLVAIGQEGIGPVHSLMASLPMPRELA